jgi:GNAT superfamily N-acetyltransferase
MSGQYETPNKNGIALFPSYINGRLEKAKSLYTIRPYHPKDRTAATKIFIDGMYEYYHKTNRRTPLPSLDNEHQQWLDGNEELWAFSFSHYVKYSLTDPNMADIENYWSLPRRSIFLVAVHNETGQVAGTVALQPGTFLENDHCPYWGRYADYIQADTTTQNKAVGNQNLFSQFTTLCNYAMGSLPADFYRIDDPCYDPKSFRSLPTVILPDPESTLSTAATSPPQPPNPPQSATCPCHNNGKCKSRSIALKASKMKKAAMLEFITETPFHELFCQCILSSESQIATLLNSKTPQDEPIPCPFCVSDAQYLVSPYLPVVQPTEDTPQQEQQYFINPILSTYINVYTASGIIPQTSMEPTQSTPTLTLTKPLPFYQFTPNGFYRRFQFLSKSHQDQLPLPSTTTNSASNNNICNFPAPLPVGIGPTTYLDFLLEKTQTHRDAKAQGIDLNIPFPTNDDEKPKVEETIPQPQPPPQPEANQTPPQTPPQPPQSPPRSPETPYPCFDNLPPATYQDLIDQTAERPEEFYLRHFKITQKLADTTPRIPALPCQFTSLSSQLSANTTQVNLPYGDYAEFRRMSVGKEHRASGLGYLLLIAALEVATTVLKFRTLHLSTSRLMDMATRFYHKSGLHETHAYVHPTSPTTVIPLAHFCWDLVPRLAQDNCDGLTFDYQIDAGSAIRDGREVDNNDPTPTTFRFKHCGTIPFERFHQASHIGDTLLGREAQQNPSQMFIAVVEEVFGVGFGLLLVVEVVVAVVEEVFGVGFGLLLVVDGGL